MPTYQYTCTACGHQLEAVQSFSDEPLTACPECGERLRKVFSSVGIVFKGSGFYRTDSRSGAASGESSTNDTPAKSETKADSPAAPSSSQSPSSQSPSPSGGNGTKSESKPAAATSTSSTGS